MFSIKACIMTRYNRYNLHTSRVLLLHSDSEHCRTVFCKRLRTVFMLTALLTWVQGYFWTRTIKKKKRTLKSIQGETRRRPVEFVTRGGGWLTIGGSTFGLCRVGRVVGVKRIWNRSVRTLPVTFLFAFGHDFRSTRNGKTQHWTSILNLRDCLVSGEKRD